MARNSAEAEFRSMAHGICKALWIERLLEDLKIPRTSPMEVYYNKKAANAIAHNLVLHNRT